MATAVVSTSDPCVFFGDYDQAKALARNCNEYQARMVADHKGRFGMFTTLPMPDPDNTLEEIAYGLDTLKAQGVGMMTSYGTKYLGDPAFIPVMEELNRRKAVLFVHRLQPACCSNVLPNVPDVVVEYGTETSRTIAESSSRTTPRSNIRTSSLSSRMAAATYLPASRAFNAWLAAIRPASWLHFLAAPSR